MRYAWVTLFLLCMMSGDPAAAAGPATAGESLRPGTFLISTPHLRDPNFYQTVVLLVTYGKAGASGVIVNRPTDVPLAQALPHVEGIEKMSRPIYFGGPVNANQMLVLLRSDSPPPGAQKVLDNIYATGSLKILTETLQDRNPDKKVRVYAGYSGWAPRQLEAEIARGDWVTRDADPEAVFSEDPSKIWPAFFGNQDQIQIRFPKQGSVPNRGLIGSGWVTAMLPDRQK